MSTVQVELPEQIRQVIDSQVAAGRVSSQSAFLVEAARRFAEEIVLDEEVAAEAVAGMRDAEEGRFVTVATQADAADLHQHAMVRLRSSLAND